LTVIVIGARPPGIAPMKVLPAPDPGRPPAFTRGVPPPPVSSGCLKCAFNLFWAMRRGMAEDEHEGRHRIAGLLALPARRSGRAKRWFLGEEAVVIFHPICNTGGSPGPAACARAS